MGDAVVFQMGAARAKLQRIVDGLRRAASGDVIERAAAKVQEQIDAVAKAKLGKHVASGTASSELQVAHSGGLIQLTGKRYLDFHAWWPFRGGKMPPFVIKNATRIFAAELLAAAQGETSAAGVEAAGVIAEAEASAAKSVAKKAASAGRRADRAYDRRVKAKEDRE